MQGCNHSINRIYMRLLKATEKHKQTLNKIQLRISVPNTRLDELQQKFLEIENLIKESIVENRRDTLCVILPIEEDNIANKQSPFSEQLT